jgi:hypothetical protein
MTIAQVVTFSDFLITECNQKIDGTSRFASACSMLIMAREEASPRQPRVGELFRL